MNVLAIDTSTSLLGIGLRTGNNYFEFNQNVGLHHTENLLTEVYTLLTKGTTSVQELDLIVVSKGPGSFTGLRIGLSTAKGISFGSKVPLVSIPTLDMYAFGLSFYTYWICPVMDARKNRVYSAFYKGGYKEGEIYDITPEDLVEKCNSHVPIILTGPFAGSLHKLFRDDPEYIDPEKKNPAKVVLDPLYAAPKTFSLLEKGVQHFLQNGADSPKEGPLYIRASEAEISLMKGGISHVHNE